MKKLLLLFPILILFSCSVQKRKYQRGYYVSWKHEKSSNKIAQNNSASQSKSADETAVADQPIKSIPEVKVNHEPSQEIYATSDNKAELLLHGDDGCDEMIFKDGTEIKVKIVERTADEIKYKRCDVPDGPIYTVRKSTLFMIKYVNGTREVFKSETPSQTPTYGNDNNAYTRSVPPKTDPLAVLALIFGILGIWPLTLLGSIAAIVLGTKSKQRIERNPEKYKGEGMAIAGQVLGIVVVSIFLLVLLIFLLTLFLFI